MTGLIIAIILTGSFAIILGVSAFLVPDRSVTDWRFICGITSGVLLFSTIILGVVIGTVAQDNHRDDGIRICNEKGGVVTQDNHCFVDNKPVEFEPGKWTW